MAGHEGPYVRKAKVKRSTEDIQLMLNSHTQGLRVLKSHTHTHTPAYCGYINIISVGIGVAPSDC